MRKLTFRHKTPHGREEVLVRSMVVGLLEDWQCGKACTLIHLLSGKNAVSVESMETLEARLEDDS